jgi:hypothetical protein
MTGGDPMGRQHKLYRPLPILLPVYVGKVQTRASGGPSVKTRGVEEDLVEAGLKR